MPLFVPRESNGSRASAAIPDEPTHTHTHTHTPIPMRGSERAMGACCRMGVPARTWAFPRVRQPAPIPTAGPPPNDPLMGVRWV
eukprot:4331660-Pyramimonas_sp.AAC.1